MGPSSADCLFDGGGHALGGAEVRFDGDGARSVGVRQFGHDLLGADFAPAGDGHPDAFGGEGPGDGEAQAAGRGGHEGGLSADSEIHQFLPAVVSTAAGFAAEGLGGLGQVRAQPGPEHLRERRGRCPDAGVGNRVRAGAGIPCGWPARSSPAARS